MKRFRPCVPGDGEEGGQVGGVGGDDDEGEEPPAGGEDSGCGRRGLRRWACGGIATIRRVALEFEMRVPRSGRPC
jgi:hypothetical protein